jgi:hypothetical protein
LRVSFLFDCLDLFGIRLCCSYPHLVGFHLLSPHSGPAYVSPDNAIYSEPLTMEKLLGHASFWESGTQSFEPKALDFCLSLISANATAPLSVEFCFGAADLLLIALAV